MSFRFGRWCWCVFFAFHLHVILNAFQLHFYQRLYDVYYCGRFNFHSYKLVICMRLKWIWPVIMCTINAQHIQRHLNMCDCGEDFEVITWNVRNESKIIKCTPSAKKIACRIILMHELKFHSNALNARIELQYKRRVTLQMGCLVECVVENQIHQTWYEHLEYHKNCIRKSISVTQHPFAVFHTTSLAEFAIVLFWIQFHRWIYC